jgi:ubiquinone/menaquinone biosynthesis C-methylase UbiE
MKILDATCGFKGMWYQKNHPLVTYMDKRNEKVHIKTKTNWKRTYNINPDVVSEWKNIPFDDEYFDMVIFDPPHIIRNKNTKEGAIEKEYGRLHTDDWKDVLQQGIKELFRVLKREGVFIFKWCESDKKVDEILKLFPFPPLFGTRTGQSNKNHWIVFLKYDVNMKLDKIQT